MKTTAKKQADELTPLQMDTTVQQVLDPAGNLVGSLPDLDDVRRGVMASRIAGHAVDIARGNQAAIARDLEMSKCRASLDWNGQIENALDPLEVRKRLADRHDLEDECSMCGKLCAMKVFS